MDETKKEQLPPNGSNCFWWSTIQHIRTNSTFYLLQAYSFRAVFEIVGENKIIVVYIDGVDKGVNHSSAVFPIMNIAILKSADPIDNMRFGVLRAFHLCLQNT